MDGSGGNGVLFVVDWIHEARDLMSTRTVKELAGRCSRRTRVNVVLKRRRRILEKQPNGVDSEELMIPSSAGVALSCKPCGGPY